MSGEALSVARSDGDLLGLGTLSLALSETEAPEVESGKTTLSDPLGVQYLLGVERGGWFRVVVTETVPASEPEIRRLSAEQSLQSGLCTSDAPLWTMASAVADAEMTR